jgi:hypothetical protein
MGEATIDALIIQCCAKTKQTASDMTTDGFLKEHIDIWLFTSTAINVRFLWNGEEFGPNYFSKRVEETELSKQRSLVVDHTNIGRCFRGYICLPGELLSWKALSSPATRASATRKRPKNHLITERSQDVTDIALCESQEGVERDSG